MNDTSDNNDSEILKKALTNGLFKRELDKLKTTEDKTIGLSKWLAMGSIASILFVFQSPNDFIGFYTEKIVRLFIVTHIVSLFIGVVRIVENEFFGTKKVLIRKIIKPGKEYILANIILKLYYAEKNNNGEKNNVQEYDLEHYKDLLLMNLALLIQVTLFLAAYVSFMIIFFLR